MSDQTMDALECRNDIVSAAAQMPQYQCHKKVWALQITGVCPQNEDGSCDLLVSDGFRPVIVSSEWLLKHSPHIGGYIVTYPDGYRSFSPKEAFESGYTRLS